MDVNGILGHVHPQPLDEKKLPDILRKYGFNNPDKVKSFTSDALSLFMNSDCVSVCLGYISLRDFNTNWMTSDKDIDKKILEHLAYNNQITKYKGVCNFLIAVGHRGFCKFDEDDDFIQMFVNVAKYYGEDKFLLTLRFTGLINPNMECLYGAILNRVAEILGKFITRRLWGTTFKIRNFSLTTGSF